MLTFAEREKVLYELRGDLQAIAILDQRVRLPFWGASWLDHQPMTLAGKRKLWTARSRLITQVERRLFGGSLPDPNTEQSLIARTLIELGAKLEEK